MKTMDVIREDMKARGVDEDMAKDKEGRRGRTRST